MVDELKYYEFECPKCDATYMRGNAGTVNCPRCGEMMTLVNFWQVMDMMTGFMSSESFGADD